MGTVIGGLLMPRFEPYDLGATLQQANQIAGGQTANQTRLIELQRLKEAQAAEAELMRAAQTDPRVQAMLFGGSTLASLPTMGGPPPSAGAGPMTQQQVMPGQPLSAPQTVPGGQDLSQFATQGAPTPTLATIGQQQGPPQAPPNPVLEMARTNPRAAMMLQQQLQGQQDAALKRQEQRLKMGSVIMESLGRRAQGATDQASWDLFLQDAVQIDPKLATRLPRVYSKEVRDGVVAQALEVKDALMLQVQDLTAQAALMKARADTQANQVRLGEVEYKETPEGWVAVPKYPGAQGQTGAGVGGAPVTVGGQPVGSLQGQKRLDEKQQQTRQAEMSLQGEYNKLAKPYMEVRDAMGRIEAAGTSPTAAGDAALLTAYMKMLDPTTGVRNEEIRNAENVGGLPQRAIGWLEWLKGGAPLKEDVRKDFMDRATKLYAQYKKDYEQNATQYREQATRQGLDPRNVVQDYRSTTAGGGRTGTQGQPTSQAPAATGGTATTAWLQQMAKKYGLTLEQARQKAAAAGVKVE